MCKKNKMAYTAKDPCPPHCFMYLIETKSWRSEGKGEGKKVSLLTHALQGAWVKTGFREGPNIWD